MEEVNYANSVCHSSRSYFDVNKLTLLFIELYLLGYAMMGGHGGGKFLKFLYRN